MKRKLYLHMGVHRTGTSAIQKTMAAQFGPLLGQGVFHAYAVPRHDALFRRIFEGRCSAAEVAQDIIARADSKPVPIDRITLSDEDIICQRDLTALAAFADYFDLHPVLYIRRQDLWLESWYRQNIKWQWDRGLAQLDFESFLAKRYRFFWIDYEKTYARIAQIADPAKIGLVVMGADGQSMDSVARFFHLIGATLPITARHVLQENASLSPQMTEFLRHFPLRDIPPPERRLIEAACAVADQTLTHHPAALLDPVQREEILAGYAGGNQRLAQRVFGRDALFSPMLPPPGQAPRHLPKDRNVALETLVWPVLRALAQMRHDASQSEAAS